MAYAYRIHDQQGVYFVTCTVTQWVDVFSRKEYADIVVDSLRYCQANKGLQILGWVIMTNHMHMIVACKEGFELSDVLRDFKKYTATQIVSAIENNKHESRSSWLLWLLKKDGNIAFWQPDNHAKEIHSSEFFKQKLEYIHSNPVRSKIVDREETYIYSSTRDYYGSKGLIELTYYD
jgi:putative transposase